MNFNDKLSAALKLLEDRHLQIPSIHYYRLIWRLGIHVPPPHFAGFFLNFLVAWSIYLVLFGAVGLLMLVFPTSPGFSRSFYIVAFGIGLPISLVLSFGYRSMGREKGIPLWRDFEPTQPAPPTS